MDKLTSVSQHSGAGRWVKASEILPEYTAARIAWRFTNKSIGGLSFRKEKGFYIYPDKFTKDYKNIEWLDEPQQIIR